jgi:hypothetical protein
MKMRKLFSLRFREAAGQTQVTIGMLGTKQTLKYLANCSFIYFRPRVKRFYTAQYHSSSIISHVFTRRFEPVLTLPQVSPALRQLLTIPTDFSTASGNFLPACAFADVFPQFGSILLQLRPIFLQFRSVVTHIAAGLTVFANLTIALSVSVVTHPIEIRVAKTPVAHVVVTPAPIVANKKSALRHLAAKRSAVTGRRLMARRCPRMPNPAFTGWGHMPWRNAEVIIMIFLCSRRRFGECDGRKECCDENFSLQSIAS